MGSTSVTVNEFTQAHALGQSGRKEQPSIVDLAVVVEGDLDAVGVLKRQHLLGAPCFWSVSSLENHYPRCKGALSYPFRTPTRRPPSVDSGLNHATDVDSLHRTILCSSHLCPICIGVGIEHLIPAGRYPAPVPEIH